MLQLKSRLTRAALVLVSSVAIALVPVGVAFAANPSGTGQPGADCATMGTTPGNAASAPGSAFNVNGTAGTMYAGQQPQNSVNLKSVSQYDVACFHQP